MRCRSCCSVMRRSDHCGGKGPKQRLLVLRLRPSSVQSRRQGRRQYLAKFCLTWGNLGLEHVRTIFLTSNFVLTSSPTQKFRTDRTNLCVQICRAKTTKSRKLECPTAEYACRSLVRALRTSHRRRVRPWTSAWTGSSSFRARASTSKFSLLSNLGLT